MVKKGAIEMSDFSIWPIQVGFHPGADKSRLTHGMNQGVMIDAAIIEDLSEEFVV